MLKLTSSSAAAALCLLGAGAWGQQAGDGASAGLSCAEVKAELASARASGETARSLSLDVHGGH